MSRDQGENIHKSTKYKKAYAEWLNSLPPEERKKLKSMKLDKHGDDNNRCIGAIEVNEQTFADTVATPSALTPEEQIEELLELHQMGEVDTKTAIKQIKKLLKADAVGKASTSLDPWNYLSTLLALIIEAPNARLAAECLCLAAGMEGMYNGISQVQIARKHCLTRAAVNKRVLEYCETLRLPPSRNMRPLVTREKYRKSRLAFVEKQR